MESTYFKEQYERILKRYTKKKHGAFGKKHDFANWYVQKLKEQGECCYYCNTNIHDINRLIDAEVLITRAVRGAGKRGPVLEVDKNNEGYTPESCVLACYYCNNDKSYTSTKDEYKQHFGPNRGAFFAMMLKEIL